MRPVSTMRSLVSRADHVLERQMDGDRHDRELRRPQHHHRMDGDAGQALGELGQIFGVAGLGEAGAVEHVLGDRIGDDGGGDAGADIGDRAADRGDRGRRARCVRAAGLGGDGDADVDDRQRAAEGGGRRRRLDHGDRNVRRDALGAPAQEFRIGEDVERIELELGAPPPRRECDVGSDPGRLAERQRQRP